MQDLDMTVDLAPMENQTVIIKVKKSDGTWAKLIGTLDKVTCGNCKFIDQNEILAGGNNLVAILRLKNLRREIHTK
jgi:hypothetical protein